MEIKIEKDNDITTVEMSKLPESVDELKELENYLKEPAFAPAMLVALMCHYKDNVEETIEMLDFINGPEEITPYKKTYYKERFIDGKTYKPFSYFEGASVDNDYTPSEPLRLFVKDNPRGPSEDDRKSFFMKSNGADNMRPVSVRLKKSTGYLYLNDEALSADIRVPKSKDEWR